MIAFTKEDIQTYSKQLNVKYFRSVFDVDNLPRIVRRNEIGIINLNKEKEIPHWVTYCKNDEAIYYFDYLGLEPPDEIQYYLKKDMHISTIKLSEENSNYSGHLCILFLKLFESHSFKDVLFFLSRIKFDCEDIKIYVKNFLK